MFAVTLLALCAFSAVSGLQTIGCFRDTGNRDLAGYRQDSGAMTNEMCADICAQRGFQFSGTQYYQECFCDNSYGSYGGANNCNTPCRGNGGQMCGGTWAILVSRAQRIQAQPAAPAAPGLKTIGCFKDTGNRDLAGYRQDSGSLTNQMCADICAQKGFKYSGTQYYQECFCDNSYGSYGPANNCNAPCRGDASQKCGGTWAILVSEAKRLAPAPSTSTHRVIGCFRDTGNRDLAAYRQDSASLTNEMCASICRSKGFKYSGTQYYQECFCDNSYGSYGAANNCNAPCKGDQSQMCGGTWAILVSEVNPGNGGNGGESGGDGGDSGNGGDGGDNGTDGGDNGGDNDGDNDGDDGDDDEESEECARQKTQFANVGPDVAEPVFEEGCKFKAKQCNAKKCFCVSPKSGEQKGGVIPLNVDYNCEGKIRKCYKKLFGILNKDGGDSAKWIPDCSSRGQYKPKQCDKKGECWCVKKKGGKEVKNTRNKDGSKVKC